MSETDNRLNLLFRRYLANTCTRQELEELLATLKKDTVDEALYQALEQHWLDSRNAAGIPDAEARLDDLLKNIRFQVGAVPIRRRAFRWRYAAAAVLLLGISVAVYLFVRQASAPTPAVVHNNTLKEDVPPGSNKAVLTLADGSAVALDSAAGRVMQQGNTTVHLQNGGLQYAVQGGSNPVSYNTLVTPRGGQYRLVLSDGTKVWLNAASRLKYPTAFTGKERVVELEGQGYFEITPDAAQPFKVRVNNMEVLALGTSFDIMAYADEKTVNATLLTGAVKVSADQESRLLQPGQQAVLAQGSDIIGVSRVNTENVIAWKNGYFSFVDADIHTIMRQLSRWYDVDVSYEGGTPQGLFSGEIGRGLTLAQALKILEQARVHFRIENNRHIVILP